jgi:hypothetical protein
VRPDAQIDLGLRVTMAPAQTTGSIALAGGQPGVFYALQPDGAAAVPLPGYFHQRDDTNAAFNKGIGQLALGIDFAIAAPSATPVADPATAPPAAPLLDTPPLATGTRIAVQATRAQTGLQATLARQALIAPLPAITLQPDVIDAGATAAVKIAVSVEGERYRLRCNGVPQGDALDGNGAELTLASDALAAPAVLEVEASRPGDTALPVQRVLQLSLAVRPDTRLAVSAADAQVRANDATRIIVQGSEPDVSYQLVAAGQAVGAPLPGNGGDLALPTGPISAGTDFAVAATRGGDARSTTLLAATASVTLLA